MIHLKKEILKIGSKDLVDKLKKLLAYRFLFGKFDLGHISERIGPRDPNQEENGQKKKGEKVNLLTTCELKWVSAIQ